MSTLRELQRILDLNALRVAEKHGHQLRSTRFFDDRELSPEDILDGLEDGSLTFGEDENEEP